MYINIYIYTSSNSGGTSIYKLFLKCSSIERGWIKILGNLNKDKRILSIYLGVFPDDGVFLSFL